MLRPKSGHWRPFSIKCWVWWRQWCHWSGCPPHIWSWLSWLGQLLARKQPSGMGLSSAVVGELLQNIVMVMVMMMIVFAVLLFLWWNIMAERVHNISISVWMGHVLWFAKNMFMMMMMMSMFYIWRPPIGNTPLLYHGDTFYAIWFAPPSSSLSASSSSTLWWSSYFQPSWARTRIPCSRRWDWREGLVETTARQVDKL